MEFIQFHPTALSIPGEEAYLISEAVRGEGAHLLDVNNVRFMPDVHRLAELAPRDVVATAIFRRMQETGSNVFLSLRHIINEGLTERFHSIDAHLKPLGINLLTDLIPIAPAAHYMVGGVRTDIWGQTNITALFACGEVASTGVMGANRLASNSLLECLVFGKRAIEKARHLSKSSPSSTREKPIKLSPATDNEFLKIKNELAVLMSDHVGIVRDEQGLDMVLSRIETIADEYKDLGSDYNYHKILNITDICRVITISALERKESRGGHVRIDFPVETDRMLHHIVQQKYKDIHKEDIRI
jgi:L-aspartate oxidase